MHFIYVCTHICVLHTYMYIWLYIDECIYIPICYVDMYTDMAYR